jgi:hypothetical protein
MGKKIGDRSEGRRVRRRKGMGRWGKEERKGREKGERSRERRGDRRGPRGSSGRKRRRGEERRGEERKVGSCCLARGIEGARVRSTAPGGGGGGGTGTTCGFVNIRELFLLCHLREHDARWGSVCARRSHGAVPNQLTGPPKVRRGTIAPPPQLSGAQSTGQKRRPRVSKDGEPETTHTPPPPIEKVR